MVRFVLSAHAFWIDGLATVARWASRRLSADGRWVTVALAFVCMDVCMVVRAAVCAFVCTAVCTFVCAFVCAAACTFTSTFARSPMGSRSGLGVRDDAKKAKPNLKYNVAHQNYVPVCAKKTPSGIS